MATSKNRRFFFFDNIKFLLMALVVIGHFADLGTSVDWAYRSIYVFIYSFHMPLFLYLSGLFHKNTKILQKIFTYIIIGYLSKLVIYLTRLILVGRAAFSFFSDGGLPWYMFVLAMFIGVTYLLRNVDKRLVIGISVLLGCIAGYFDFIGDFLYLSRFFVFYPFYFLGTVTPKIVLVNLNKFKTAKIIGACILTLWLILCFTQIKDLYSLRMLFTGRNPFSANEKFAVWGFFYRLLCYLITTIVSLSLISLIPRKNIPYISDFGQNTLQVYFWHTAILLVFRKLGIPGLLVNSFFGGLLWILMGLLLSVILSTKVFAFPTKQVTSLCAEVFKQAKNFRIKANEKNK